MMVRSIACRLSSSTTTHAISAALIPRHLERCKCTARKLTTSSNAALTCKDFDWKICFEIVDVPNPLGGNMKLSLRNRYIPCAIGCLLLSSATFADDGASTTVAQSTTPGTGTGSTTGRDGTTMGPGTSSGYSSSSHYSYSSSSSSSSMGRTTWPTRNSGSSSSYSYSSSSSSSSRMAP